MPLLIGIIALCAPRFVIAMLWLFSTWFTGVFETRAWPILGFIFLPLTLLWYSAVTNWFMGEWNWWQMLVLVLAIFGDLHSERNVSRGE
jgi:hypothetical protein